MEYHIIISGQGITTRANVEALIDDHFIANGKDGVVLLPFYRNPSQAQKWAAQFAKDNEKRIVTFSPNDASLPDVPKSDNIVDEEPIQAAINFSNSAENVVGFLLWDDEDQESADTLALCSKAGIKCFDLTTGLVGINPSEGLEVSVRPSLPIQEVLENSIESTDESEIEEDDEEGEEVEVEETLTDAITFIAQIFAKEIAAEVKRLMDK